MASETIIDISDWFPAPWTLIGARMVQLHAMSGGREVPRVSLDADALAFRARGRDAAHRIVIGQGDPVEARLRRVAYDERRLEGAV